MQFALLILLPAVIALPSQLPLRAKEETPPSCDCSGTSPALPGGNGSICQDWRLGPVEIPRKLPLLSFVSDYDRFGGQKPGDFLKKWTNPTSGRWVYPDNDGFCLDQQGRAIVGNMTLEVGTKVDRFGSEGGESESFILRLS